jgi:hypothetical protein
LLGNYRGLPFLNRFWLNVTPSGTPGATEVLALSNAVAAAFRTRFGAQLSIDWHSTNQRTVWFKSSTDEVAVDGSDTGSGSINDVDAPIQCCYLINWAISGSYRGGHPRSYLAGVTMNGLSNDRDIASTKRTNLSTAATNFLSDVNALTPSGWSAVQLGTFAFFRGLSALNPPVFKPFNSGSCNGILATQRRRLQR